jgi:hypothetical protein
VAVYWLVGLGVLYLVWPYLWNDPIRHLLDSVVVMVRFPFTGRVLYQGQVYGVTEIPWHYLFASLLYQLTLPALVLGFAGTVLAVVARRRVETAVHLLWLLLPLGTALLLGAQVYDAFRQMLFILPPFFVLGALTWERVFRKVGGAGWRALIVAVALLPGLVAIVRLHPYEAIYHNELVGGVRGAFRRFELDGWCLSYREAIETINAVAPQGARVGVPTEAFTVQPFAREDLRVQPLRTDADWPSGQAGYLLTCTRSNADLKRFPDAEILWVVERDGAWLTVVKRLP